MAVATDLPRASLRPGLACAACLLVVAATVPTLADEGKKDGPPGVPSASIATSLPQNGDPTGARAALAGRGITGGVNYIGEVFGNTSGGIKRGAIYDGRLEVYLDVDFEKLSGWNGLTFHVNGYQIHGDGLTANNVGNLFPVSYIEATPATRLFEAWFEQQLAGDKATVRFGQLAADSEFFTSETAGQFINSTFGWASSFAESLPSGGAAYPLATPGVRVYVAPTEALAFRVAAFNGDPAGPRCAGDPQRCNNNGLDFRLQDPVFLIAEAQIKYNQDKSARGLPGILKLGAWQHFGKFDDRRLDTAGVPFGISGNDPRGLDGNSAFYAVIDQQVYAGANESAVHVFARVTGAEGDRNDIDWYVDGGVKFSGFVPGRPDDTFGVAGAYAQISNRARGADRDAGAIVRDYEAMIEASYTAQIISGWTLQPDFQYIWHPGGRVDDGTGKPIADAAVFGLRTSVNY
ncbi:MAG: carbohydrate porin [Hyphomicrobiaceae bacterium]|nr:carbohydrate porin [Hyphomicrobiaceae bacterium]